MTLVSSHQDNQTQKTQVRVRFAPSPTGNLHIGGVRTALFNWLFAQHHQGVFLVRIEDTDLERSKAEYTQEIMDSLHWLGITWDETPLFQSQQREKYLTLAQTWVTQGHAYYCFCSEQEVEEMRVQASARGEKPQYNRSCRHLKYHAESLAKPWVIRARVPQTAGGIEFHDLIRGLIHVPHTEIDDFVLIRSSGVPTYNLSVVVDDAGSQISHVLRGDDHINNTPKQILLYQFLGQPLPQFGHFPMILGPDKKKLSKRHGAVSAMAYRQEGYLPEALLNFLVRLGWSHGDQEIFTSEEMIRFFELSHVQASSGVFNSEKLLWLNGAHLRQVAPQRLIEILLKDFQDRLTASQILRLKTTRGLAWIELIQQKVRLIQEIPPLLAELWEEIVAETGSLEHLTGQSASQITPDLSPSWNQETLVALKCMKAPELVAKTQGAFTALLGGLAAKGVAQGGLEGTGAEVAQAWGGAPCLRELGWTGAEIDGLLKQVGEAAPLKMGEWMPVVRFALTGQLSGLHLADLLALLPWQRVKASLALFQASKLLTAQSPLSSSRPEA